MDQIIHNAWGITITPWKLVGYLGVVLFAGRADGVLAHEHLG